ncbi:MAG: alpha-1,2-fucosyltransferase, partial [Campylobacterales bacterium]|nr:alpha-1,2-fucosyltransferase [Campylobacterales bacterium]
MNIRLYGGLGNQIFQLSAALLMAKKCNHSVIFYDDSSIGAYAVARKNEVEFFFDFSNAGLTLVKKKSFVHKLRLTRLFPFINFFVSDRNFASAIDKPCVSFRYLDGYFQDCLTASDFTFLIDTFKSCLLQYEVNVKAPSTCVIHVRGGDFVKLGWDSVASKDYYIRAIEFMINKYGVRSFDIITDDVSYAK